MARKKLGRYYWSIDEQDPNRDELDRIQGERAVSFPVDTDVNPPGGKTFSIKDAGQNSEQAKTGNSRNKNFLGHRVT